MPPTDPAISFFQTAAPLAAAGLGLTLTALQLRTKDWQAKPHLRALAISFLAELLAVVIMSLIVAAPGHEVRLAAGLGAAIILAAEAQFYVSVVKRPPRRWADWLRFGASIALSLPVAGLLICKGAVHDEVEWVAGLCIWLIFSGFFEVGSLIFYPEADGSADALDPPDRRTSSITTSSPADATPK